MNDNNKHILVWVVYTTTTTTTTITTTNNNNNNRNHNNNKDLPRASGCLPSDDRLRRHLGLLEYNIT